MEKETKKPTQIFANVPVVKDAETLLYEVLENLPEYAISFKCTGWHYGPNTDESSILFTFLDYEDRTDSGNPKIYVLNLEKAIEGLKKLIDAVAEGKIHLCGLDLLDMNDGGNWDADAVDALLQYSLLGELVYG